MSQPKRMPYRQSAAYTVCKTIFDHGSLTIEQGVMYHRILGAWISKTREVYKNCVLQGWLDHDGDKYALTDWVQIRMAQENRSDEPELVPPRVVNIWTNEMQGYQAKLMQGFNRRPTGGNKNE